MSDGQDTQNVEPQKQPRRVEDGEPDMLDRQEGKGYGEDEGERDEALRDE